jgi:hypothetical protein
VKVLGLPCFIDVLKAGVSKAHLAPPRDGWSLFRDSYAGVADVPANTVVANDIVCDGFTEIFYSFPAFENAQNAAFRLVV